MSGYLLILAIICLGGAIATIGDRLGSRVGKARLSLFKMRPKQTAVVVTILTGSIISSLTLGILLATSRELRDGLIRIEEINKKSQLAEAELKDALTQKESAETELSKAQDELDFASNRLRTVRRSLDKAREKQKESEASLKTLKNKFNQAQTQLKQTRGQTQTLKAQLNQLDQTSRQLKQEQADLISQRNQAQKNLSTANTRRIQLEQSVQAAQSRLNAVEQQKSSLENAIATAQIELQSAKEQEVQSREMLAKAQTALEQASAQRTELVNEIQELDNNRQRLEQDYLLLFRSLRQGSIALRSGQVLADGVVSDIKNVDDARNALDKLLDRARINAIVQIDPPDAVPDRPVISISPRFVNEAIQTLLEGKPYFIRIVSINNYLQGEGNVKVAVFPIIQPNVKVYSAGDPLSVVEFIPTQIDEEAVISKLESLFGLANQNAVQNGMPVDPLEGTIGEFNNFKLFKFATALKLGNFSDPVQVYTIAKNDTFTSGPLQLELVAQQNNQILLRSN